jgi:hypothetical protein
MTLEDIVMNEHTRTHARAAQAGADTSSVGLVTQLTGELATLVRKEVALARSELTQSFKSAKSGLVGLVAGGLFLFAGFLVLLWAAVLGLSEVMAPWLAAVIVGGVVAVIGLIMVQSGKHKLDPAAFKPTHTANSLHKDRNALRGATT